jgi:hypothetical protein
MLAAGLGLAGVLFGAFLTQALSASWQRRKERLEALVALVAASARVIGAHERLYELFSDGSSPPTDSAQARQAFAERVEAHADWRTAQARAEILIQESDELKGAIDDFGRARAAATSWVQEYQRLGAEFLLTEHAESQREWWQAMRHARYDLIAAGRAVSLHDARWLRLPARREALAKA